MASTLIGQAFVQAKKLYNQTPDTFYISSDDILVNGEHTFLHKAILPPYRRVAFTEYSPGNIDDVAKIYSLMEKGTFKSFYCSLCASGEDDNFIRFTDSSDAEPVQAKNYSAVLRHRITIDKKVFLVTGTYPQYLYNHLLLFPEVHISSNLCMMSGDYVHAFYEILEKHAPITAKLIYNGNFGSDVYHAHVHITDQKFSIIDESIRLIKRDGVKAGVNSVAITSPIVNVITLYSHSTMDLYTEMVKYFMIYFTPGYDKQKMFTTSLMYIDVQRSRTIYMATIFVGKHDSRNKVVSPMCSVNWIAPAYLLNFTACDAKITRPSKVAEPYVQEYLNVNELLAVKSNMDNLFKGTTNPATVIDTIFKRLIQSDHISRIPSEIIQWILFKFPLGPTGPVLSAELCSNLQKYIVDILGDPLSCLKRDRQCGPVTFATYKILLSMWIMCTIRLNNGAIDHIYRNPLVLTAATYGEMYVMENIYGITSTKSLVIKNRTANAIVLKTMRALLNVAMLSDEYNSWMNYRFKQIGDNSAFGIITTSTLKSINHFDENYPFVIKINKGAPVDSFNYESVMGIAMTEMRKYVPNFALVYAGFKCSSPKDYSQLCKVIDPSGMFSLDRVVQYIIMEYLHGQSFNSYLRTAQHVPGADLKILAHVAQVALALAMGKSVKKFTHYDFHTGNDMVCDTGEYFYQYHINGKIYGIKAFGTNVIIDYGSAYVSGLAYYPVDQGEAFAYGRTIDRYKKTADIYCFLANMFFVLSMYNPIFIRNSMAIQELAIKFQLVYQKLFRQSITLVLTTIIENQLNTHDAISLLQSNRVDDRYYMYIPYDYDNDYGPLELYEDIKNILIKYGGGHLVIKQVHDKVCSWGDVNANHGCDVPLVDYVVNANTKIANLKLAEKN